MRIYSTEELYSLTYIALHDGREGGLTITFWKNMMDKYGSVAFQNRDAHSLLSKWKRIEAEVGRKLPDYHLHLERTLGAQKARKLKHRLLTCDQRGGNGKAVVKDLRDVKKQLEIDTDSESKPCIALPLNNGKRESPYRSKKKSTIDPEVFLESVQKLRKLTDTFWKHGTVALHESKLQLEVEVERALDLNLLQAIRHKPSCLASFADHADQAALLSVGTEDLFNCHSSELQHFMVIRRGDTIVIQDVREMRKARAALAGAGISAEIRRLSMQYGRPQEHLYVTLERVSGDIAELEKSLHGQEVVVWNELEDMALMHPHNQRMYECLVLHKGIVQIQKRKAYLNSCTPH